jgi:hypothetical protein
MTYPQVVDKKVDKGGKWRKTPDILQKRWKTPVDKTEICG